MLTPEEAKRLEREHRVKWLVALIAFVTLMFAAGLLAYALVGPEPQVDTVTLNEDESYTFDNTSLISGGFYLKYVKWSEDRLVFRYLSNNDRNVFHVAAKPGTTFIVNKRVVKVESVTDVIHTIRLTITPIKTDDK